MKLYFINSYNERKLVKENVKENEVTKEISNYVASLNPNYKIYYFRSWSTKEGIMYDVGSHLEFFLLIKNME